MNQNLGDFFESWMDCLISTKAIGSRFALQFVENMKHRELTLFQNASFLAAICLDPRFKVILTNEQTATAFIHLGIHLV